MALGGVPVVGGPLGVGSPGALGVCGGGGGGAGEGAGGQDDGELLAALAVAGVVDDVLGVAVDAGDSGDLAGDPGFFQGFAYGCLGDGFAEVDGSAGDGPVAVVGTADHEDLVVFVGHDHVHRRDQAVGLGRLGVVVVVDPPCHEALFQSSGVASSHTRSKLST